MVFFPINWRQEHWALAVVDFREQGIFYYDSLAHLNYHDQEYLTRIVTYIEKEHMTKIQQPIDTTFWRLETVQDVPRQNNGVDCGVFLCKYMDFLSTDEKLAFQHTDIQTYRPTYSQTSIRTYLHMYTRTYLQAY